MSSHDPTTPEAREARMAQSLGPKPGYSDPPAVAEEDAPEDFGLAEPGEPDMVDHPPHYNFATIEPIDVIEDWQLGFHEGNAVKYIARAQHKGNELQDLKKAMWYLLRRIEQVEGTGEPSGA